MPFYSRGSLSGKTFSYEQLRSSIIPCLNEGLKALHDAKIIHKDLKPSNIMVTDGIHDFVDIDFMESVLSSNNSDSDAAQIIVEEARKNGSTDDTTIIILRR